MSSFIHQNSNLFPKIFYPKNIRNKFIVFCIFIFILCIGFILGATYEKSTTIKNTAIVAESTNQKVENLLTDDPIFSKTIYSPSKKYTVLFLSKTINNNLETVNNVVVGIGPYEDTIVYSALGGGAGGPSISSDSKIWSPDENYFYINESYPDFVNILVFRSDGKPFANGQQYLDVNKLLQSQTGYFMNNGETWVSNNEISFETYKQGVSKSPNYIINVKNQTLRPG